MAGPPCPCRAWGEGKGLLCVFPAGKGVDTDQQLLLGAGVEGQKYRTACHCADKEVGPPASASFRVSEIPIEHRTGPHGWTQVYEEAAISCFG